MNPRNIQPYIENRTPQNCILTLTPNPKNIQLHVVKRWPQTANIEQMLKKEISEG
jgi:hypothetical protein